MRTLVMVAVMAMSTVAGAEPFPLNCMFDAKVKAPSGHACFSMPLGKNKSHRLRLAKLKAAGILATTPKNVEIVRGYPLNWMVTGNLPKGGFLFKKIK
tara:strand:+ start:155 stop:448 length:294 start_codon:yes stop_codon:yes gene_type:complete